MSHNLPCVPSIGLLVSMCTAVEYELNMGIQEALELAGMTDTSGSAGKALPPGYLIVPGSIEPTVEGLKWRYSDQDHTPSTIRAPKNTLDKFLKLTQANPAAIVKFARAHGVLEGP